MAFDEFVSVQKALAAILAAYLLGSIPFAYITARLRGVDIFATGNRTAGTANVFWNIGRRTGTLVFIGDVAKGSAAVLVARLLDVPVPIVLVAAGAAILGHWKPVFARFRGGDGMATLMGTTLALTPILAPMGIVAGFAMILVLRRSVWRSSYGIATCFALMMSLSLFYQQDRSLVLALSGLAGLVLARSSFAHWRRGRVALADAIALDLEKLDLDLDLELELELELDPESDLGPAAPENR
ncbi:MAG: glycerol-3-phosphate acyltransferase [Chloroflexi bacterium]|nr:glycerol-3-phosphate acyltransferase [Chloroflexota bacterium]